VQLLVEGCHSIVAQTTSIVVWALGIFYYLSFLFFNQLIFLFDFYSVITTRRHEQLLMDGHSMAQTTSIVVWAQVFFNYLSFLFFN